MRHQLERTRQRLDLTRLVWGCDTEELKPSSRSTGDNILKTAMGEFRCSSEVYALLGASGVGGMCSLRRGNRSLSGLGSR